jgi:mannosyltransferase OCH1-like enzyme
MSSLIPKIIHQTFPTKELPQSIADNPNSLKTQNPDWTYTIYDDDDILDFIRDEYGSSILSTYLNVSPLYGAARADLFRYLLMYKMGGIYLDIKSTSVRPFSDALTLDEGFVLSHWRNGPGQEFQGSGIHPELAALPGGEFQQWFIICKPSHPYLAAVIDRVLENIARYRPWRGGVGRTGVLRLTGPIAYSLAIEPIKNLHKHVELQSHDEIGLAYNALGTFDHRTLFKRHYTQLDTPIVRSEGLTKLATNIYITTRRIKHKIVWPNEEL